MHRLIAKVSLTFSSSMPPAAFDALVQRVVLLVDAPWDAAIMPPGSDPAYRITMFGSGNGLLTFHAGRERRRDEGLQGTADALGRHIVRRGQSQG
jgi:hypothetical protein